MRPQKYIRTIKHTPMEQVPWADSPKSKVHWALDFIYTAALWAAIVGGVVVMTL